MSNRLFVALFGLVMLFVIVVPVAPAGAWEYQDGTPSDTIFERFGPRADKVLIKLYASELHEFDALGAGEIDITDWPLTQAYYNLYTNPPYDEQIKVIFYGDEFGISLLDVNNNNNEYLGNPPNPAYTNPVYPNPTSVAEMRQAIAHLCDRAQFDTIIGVGFYAPIYTPFPPSNGYYHPCLPEYLKYPYSRPDAEAKLEAGGFTLTGSPDGWRYWDRDNDDVKDAGEDLELKVFIRADVSVLREFGVFICDELEAVGVHVIRVFGNSEAARIQVMANKDFNLYTGYWRLGVDPDHCILWNWDFYWHPGRPYNYAGINDPELNDYSYGVMLANTQAEALTNCLLFQERYAEIAASVPLFSYVGSKGMSRRYTGGNGGVPAGDAEDIYRGQYWEGAVNTGGYGVDSFWSFLNMHPQGYERGNGEMTIRHGFKVSDIKSHNPVYAEWLWDWKALSLQLDSLLVRNPYNLAEFMPWLAQSYEVGTYPHLVYGTCTKIRFTLRPDATWHDGTPITMADIYFTFVELDDILAARGLPPPWWISNVANILGFSILDVYNFEVLLDLKAVFALGWIGGNLILPKHIWKPLAESGDIESNRPDPNCVLSGPYRFVEYVEYSHVLLVANKPGSTVTTTWPGSTPITSPHGYFVYSPLEISVNIRDVHGGTLSAKFEQGPDVAIDIIDRCEWQPSAPQNIAYNKTVDIRRVYPTTPVPGLPMGVTDKPVTLTQPDPPGPSMDNETFSLGVIPWGVYKVTVIKNITEPLWAEQVITFTQLFYVTKKEDIAGKTYYDDIGWGTYPFKSQLLSPDIKVDIKDVAVAAKAFGSYPRGRWNTAADLNHDYKIDIRDIAAIAKQFGWTGN